MKNKKKKIKVNLKIKEKIIMNNDSIDIYFTLKREVLNNMEGNKRNYLLNSKKEITYFFLI